MRLIAVTGMHRSGTSTVTRVVGSLGPELGPDEAMMQPNDENPRGFWELQAASLLNELTMDVMGGRWHRLPGFPEGWEHAPELAASRNKAKEILDAVFQRGTPNEPAVAAFKDPRLAVMLPLWRTAHPIETTLTPVRDPREVVQSIVKRDEFEPAHAAGLWVDHLTGAVVNDPDTRFTLYHDLLADPVVEAERIAQQLGIEPPPLVRLVEVRNFVDTGLRRNKGVDAPWSRELDIATMLFDAVKATVESEDARPQLVQISTAIWNARNNERIARDEMRREAQAQRDRLELEKNRADNERQRAEELRERIGQAERELRESSSALGRRTNELAHARRAAERWETEYHRLANRRVVKAALGAVEPLRPAFRAVRKLRGTPDPRAELRARSGKGRGGKKDQETDAPAKHVPATQEAADALTTALRDAAPTPAMADDAPTVAIVMLTRDGLGHLRTCLPAIAETDYPNLRLVVVDNGSTDGSREYLAEYAEGVPFDVTVIHNEHNATFSAGNNQGVDAAGDADLILLLNNDIEPVHPSWLSQMVSTLDRRDAAAVGARLIYPRREGLDNAGDTVHPDLTLQHRGLTFESPFDGVPRARNLGAGEDPQSAVATGTRPRPGVTAACLLVRADALQQVGGLTESYIYGTEDVDLCLKLREAGHRIIYDGTVALWHHEFGTQNAEGRERKRQNRIHNRDVFLSNWGPRLRRQLLTDKISAPDRAGDIDREPFTDDVLHVAITVTKDDPTAGFGDYYTAHEFGDALAALGWQVSYIERHDERWYDVDPSVDVIVAMLDAYDIRQAPPGVVTCAWVRNWAARWTGHDWFDDYDIVFGSSTGMCEFLRAASVHEPVLLPLAANPKRFNPDAAAAGGVEPVDVAFVGSRWKRPREIEDALPSVAETHKVGVWGHGWEDASAMRPLTRGPVDYNDVPAVYANATLVVDDTASHAKPYGAVNSRVFDALAAGTLVVTDNAIGISELFDTPVPHWQDAHALSGIVTKLLQDETALQETAAALRAEVLEKHTYAHRAATFRQALERHVAARSITIAIGVPRDEERHRWGDHHFARDLQQAFIRRGHPTRVSILPDWDSARTASTDVVVHLFGLSEYTPRPAQINVLWNISHPELVTPELIDKYDVAFVASQTFADKLDAECATPVHPLLQCTNPQRMHPEPLPAASPLRSGPGGKPQLLFIGNSRGVRRTIIDDVLPTELHLQIHGPDWTDELVDMRHVVSDGVPNDEVHRAYHDAAINLNDHWSDMREHGFISNRLFDILASGGFVVSDHVDGMEDIFGDTVVTYRDADELQGLLRRWLDDEAGREALAAKGRQIVLDGHTFDHRAQTIVGAIASELADRPVAMERGTAAFARR